MEVRTLAIVKNVLTTERIQVRREPQREQIARRPITIVARVVQKATW